MVGVCGGFTTFSTFSLETLHLVRDGQWWRAGANVAASLALCLAGVWAGAAAATWWNER
jgi:CrcB protein